MGRSSLSGASLARLIAASHLVLWRAIHALDGRLTAPVAGLAAEVRDVDRRLARLEGWIEDERVGRGSTAREAPDAGGEGGG